MAPSPTSAIAARTDKKYNVHLSTPLQIGSSGFRVCIARESAPIRPPMPLAALRKAARRDGSLGSGRADVGPAVASTPCCRGVEMIAPRSFLGVAQHPPYHTGCARGRGPMRPASLGGESLGWLRSIFTTYLGNQPLAHPPITSAPSADLHAFLASKSET